VSLTINDAALARITTEQMGTLIKLSNDRNLVEVFTSFELPDDYIAFLLWSNLSKTGTPIYGGIDKAGVAST
jgi:hypothetical protein